MPDRTPNRPRIAGQRRPAARPTGESRPQDAPPDVEDTPAADVTPATVESADPLVMVPSERRGMFTIATMRLSALRKVTEAAEAEAPAARARGLSAFLSVTLAVLIVVVLAVAGILALQAWKGQQAEDARGQAAAAGRKAAETALSYDYRSLDKNFAAARATMTPEFAAKFDPTAKVAGDLAKETKATVRAEVREVGVRDGDADRVTLVIFVNQTTTSTITEGKPRVDLNRTRFTMVRNGDQWLVQEIAGL